MDKSVKRKTNPVLQDIIRDCEEAARTNDAAIWADVAEELKRANRAQREINISHIERNAEDGETVVVPGKVMGSGRLTKNITVAALEFSGSAREAINETGEVVYIEDLVEDNPTGSEVKILG